MATNNTAAADSTSSNNNNNNNNNSNIIVRDNVKSANSCVQCGEELVSDIDGAHESLCNFHQHFSAGGELLSSSTAADSSSNSNSNSTSAEGIVRDNVKSTKECVECGQELDSRIDGAHESLCSVHQHFSGGGEPTSSSTAADSSSNNISDEFGVDWAEVEWPNDCEGCGRKYDCIDHKHESVCGVCQNFPDDDEPTSSSTAFGNTTMGQPRCPIDNRRFWPNANNNGRHCTFCCNRRAEEGFDLWAEVGLVPTPKAQGLLRAYQERH